jgi:hypothetical protein
MRAGQELNLFSLNRYRTSRNTGGMRGNQWCCWLVGWPSYPRVGYIIRVVKICLNT